MIKQATVSFLSHRGIKKGDAEFTEFYQTIYRGVAFALVRPLVYVYVYVALYVPTPHTRAARGHADAGRQTQRRRQALPRPLAPVRRGHGRIVVAVGCCVHATPPPPFVLSLYPQHTTPQDVHRTSTRRTPQRVVSSITITGVPSHRTGIQVQYIPAMPYRSWNVYDDMT